MSENEDYELTWQRNPETGSYWATDDRPDPPVTYGVGRTRDPDRRWVLSAASRDFPPQLRIGFSQLRLAKLAALRSRCARCGRSRPFGSLEETGPHNWWTCRDREDCDKITAALADEERQLAREIRNTDLAAISVRDGDGGPELVFRREFGHGQASSEVIRCTENDLITLTRVLLTRFWEQVSDGQLKFLRSRENRP